MRTIYTPSTIDSATESRLWQDAVIIFDTCAILDFYYMSYDHQVVMADILKFLSDRIWLPAQVIYEYEKNRKSVITKPINENYRDQELQGNHLVEDLKSYISQWEREYYHPFITSRSLKSIKEALADIEPKIAEIKKTVSIEYQARKSEILGIIDRDAIEEAVISLKHGEPFSYAEVINICKEGSFRYENQIPPGYEDAKVKNGIRQYGDLIIWKEVLKYAHENKCDVIFITNDTKPDWSIASEIKGETLSSEEIGNPRRELLVEFEEETGKTIWFYNTSRFISKLEESYKPKQGEIAFYGQLGVVRDVLARLERERKVRKCYTGDAILIRCDSCGELFSLDAGEMDFDWQGGVVDEDRGMGCEMEYESKESCECPNCNNQIDLTLRVWEYPVGVFNYQDIDIEGGEVDKAIDLRRYIELGNYGLCERCGEKSILNSSGLCPHCEAEFKRIVESED